MFRVAYRTLCAALIALGLLGILATGVSAQAGREVVVAKVDGIVNPVLADYMTRVIEQGELRNAAAVVFQLDTPGGLDTSMRAIIQRALASRVPVVMYVSPPGARAGSAGVYLVYAGHIAAMAPNTNIGSATPVLMGEGGEARMSDEMRAKVTNDAVAYVKSLAQQRGRNADWAEKAVREGANVTANEAAQLGVVDLIAPDVPSLLQQIDGRTVETVAGPTVLQTAGATLAPAEMTPLERFLHTISNPTIAYILLSLGSLGLMLELYNPGQILPGVVGVICLLLAFYALGTLPVNYAGLLLMGFALLLFIADVFSPTHGILTVGGIIAFVLGSLMLFNAPDGAPFLQVSLPVIVTMTAIFAGFFVVVVAAVMRSRRRKSVTGREGLLGATAEVRTRLAPQGMVFVESELWRARSVGRAVEVGERVRVLRLEGLTLEVEPLSAEAPAAPMESQPAAAFETSAADSGVAGPAPEPTPPVR